MDRDNRDEATVEEFLDKMHELEDKLKTIRRSKGRARRKRGQADDSSSEEDDESSSEEEDTLDDIIEYEGRSNKHLAEGNKENRMKKARPNNSNQPGTSHNNDEDENYLFPI